MHTEGGPTSLSPPPPPSLCRSVPLVAPIVQCFLHLKFKNVKKKIELKFLLGQTHSFRVNFRFNQIIIDDVTIMGVVGGHDCGLDLGGSRMDKLGSVTYQTRLSLDI